MELTQHVKQRYAERMAGRDTKIDINTYIVQNEEKIEKDVSKLIEHSTIIYMGMCNGHKDPVTVRLSGTWVIVMNQSDRVVITLFKIDFGLTEDFNKRYVTEWLEKLNTDLDILNEKRDKVREEVESYRTAIKSNDELIAEYEAVIKRLKNDNRCYDGIIKDKNAEYFGFEMVVRNDLDAFMKRREF